MSVRELRDLGVSLGDAAGGRAASAWERLILAARDQDLLDVAFSYTDSPFGPLLVAVTDHGLVRLAYPNEHPDEVLQELADRVSPRVLECPAETEEVRKELDEYFDGHRRDFDVDVDLTLARGRFTRTVLEAAERIPFGEVLTYGEIATEAGSPRGARAAGNALGSNPIPIVVPCHRVVHAGGGLGGYTGGLSRKVTLLTLEGALPGSAAGPAPG
jgi:methylated-DNA-[protein]-cysteine S-methyltransferase